MSFEPAVFSILKNVSLLSTLMVMQTLPDCLDLFVTFLLLACIIIKLNITFMDLQSTEELQSSTQASHEPKSEQPNNHTTDAPVADSGSASASSNDSKKVSRQDIELVRISLFAKTFD